MHFFKKLPLVSAAQLGALVLLPPALAALTLFGNRLAAAADSAPKPASRVADTDGDQLTDLQEQLYGSNPLRIDTDGDGHSDWEEAHNMLNPNQSPWEDAKLIDRFRFNSVDWRSDEGISPSVAPPSSQQVESFEEKAIGFPATGSTPLVFNLATRPVDLAYGTVRFWYVPDGPLNPEDTAWRTLIHARGIAPNSTVFNWLLELQPSSRQIVMSSSLSSGELRQNFVGTLPVANTPGQEVFELCFSYTAGSTWMSVNDTIIGSKIPIVSASNRGLGVDLGGAKGLNGCETRLLAIGGRIAGTRSYDQPARGWIDDLEWFNNAMSNPVPFSRSATPWGVTRRSPDLRRFGGWAISSTDGQGIEINLRRAWEGVISTTPGTNDPYRLERREWGATGPSAWQSITQGTRKNVINDTGVTPGKWYEYRLPSDSKNYAQPIWGFAGHRPALTSGPGYAIVVGVDRELLSWEANNGALHQAINDYTAQLKIEFGSNQVLTLDTLERMQDDPDFNGQLDPKVGAVPIFDVGTPENARYQNDLSVNKNAISNAFRNIPNYLTATKLIVLIGHVTVPLGGNAAEDGHRTPLSISAFESPSGSKKYHPVHQSAHLGAWACDVWYGDYDVVWKDDLKLSDGKSAFINGTARIDWQAHNVIGDGKFDHNTVPPDSTGVVDIDAGVGRIDFSKMPGFVKAEDGQGAERFKNAELRMTTSFLRKTLTFHRNDPLDTSQRPTLNEVQLLCGSPRKPSIPVDGFAGLSVPALSVSVRQFKGALPGSAWTDLFNAGKMSMWGFHGHYGSYNRLGGTWDQSHFSEHILGNTRWCHSVVAGLLGSFFGDWNHEPENLYPPYDLADQQPLAMSAGNLLKAVLAQPTGGLVVTYGPNRNIDFSRAAAGFPVGVFLRDSVEWYGQQSCRTLFILGDPTIIAQ